MTIRNPLGMPPLALLFVLLLFLQSRLQAQEYLIHNYTENEGLSSSMVHDVTQDSLGRMYFATRAGISRYDGSHWETLLGGKKGEYQSFSRLKIDQRGGLWALPSLGGLRLAAYRNGQWTYLVAPVLAHVEEYVNFDVVYWDDQPAVALCANDQGFWLYQNGEWLRPLEEAGASRLSATGVVRYRQGFLIATSGGLRYLTSSGVESIPLNQVALPTPNVQTLQVEQRGGESRGTRLWASGRDWLGYFELGMFHAVDLDLPPVYKERFSKWEETSFLPDGGQGVYFQKEALFYYHFSSDTLFPLCVKSGLLASKANALFRDRENNIWIATERGVSKLVSMRFANYRRAHGLLDNEVTSILETAPGRMIFGHNTGLSFYDKGRFTTLPFLNSEQQPDSRARVLEMVRDGKGTIWLACNYRGLARLTPERQLTWVQSPALHDELRSVAVDAENTLWVGGRDGLFTLNNQRVRPVSRVNKRVKGIRRISFGPDGRLFLATTAAGLYVYSQDRLTQYYASGNRAANSIYVTQVMGDGQVLVGTKAGLYCVRNQSLEPLSLHGQVIERPVYGMLLDRKQRLWVGTDNGLICVEETGLRHIYKRQGFAGKELNRDAFCMDAAGSLWFGSDMGASRFIEAMDHRQNMAPVARLMALEVNGVEREVNCRLVLNHDENFWNLSFYGNSFLDEDVMRFRVKLEGFDTQWVEGEALSNREIRYTNLYPGAYRFHIQAANLEGQWSAVVSSAPIIIRHPFWQSYWFYAFAILSLAGLFYLGMHYVADRKHAKNLETLVEERTRQLAESEEKYRLIAENPIDSIALIQNGSVIWGNAMLGHLFGMARDELMGTSLTRLLHVDDGHCIDTESLCLLNAKEPLHHYEAQGRHHDGFLLDLEIFSSEQFLYKQRSTVLCLLRDISEPKAVDRQLRASLREKEVLLKEVHHRVKNNLQIISSLLSLQSRYVLNPDALDVFMQSQNRIRTMALLHEKIYQSSDLSRIESAAYIRSLVHGLMQIFHVDPDRIQIDMEVDRPLLNIDEAVPCGLIINELLSNALKYAFPPAFQGKGCIAIVLRTRENGTDLEVSDNGVGLPEAFNPQTAQSLGLKLVYILGEEQLRGKVTVQRHRGTRFTVSY